MGICLIEFDNPQPLGQGTQGGLRRVQKIYNQDNGYQAPHVVCYYHQGYAGYKTHFLAPCSDTLKAHVTTFARQLDRRQVKFEDLGCHHHQLKQGGLLCGPDVHLWPV